VQIATSNSDGYALTSTGAVWAWGVGSYGELGDGKTPPYDTTAVKVAFPAGIKIASWRIRCRSTAPWPSTRAATCGDGGLTPTRTSASRA
jgi:hypothetical protein